MYFYKIVKCKSCDTHIDIEYPSVGTGNIHPRQALFGSVWIKRFMDFS